MAYIWRSRHRIGVIGILNAGKTVFITSLINHIKHHDPDILRLRDGKSKIVFDKEEEPDSGFERFPYARYRAEAHKVWPDQTERPSQYKCSFFRTDWKYAKGELSIFDIPGERLCDLIMEGMDFSKWSDWLLDFMMQDREHSYRDQWRDYLDFLHALGETAKDPQSAEIAKKQIIERYSALLVKLAFGFRPIVTPSAFVLSPEGVHLGESIIKNDLSKCHPGLDEGRAFAPLSSSFRAKNPEITKAFASHYKAYRLKIAKPIWQMFHSCNELVVLVDVVTLLNANTGMYNGNRELLGRTIDLLSPGHGFFENIGRAALAKAPMNFFRVNGIQRLALVATKADLVRKEDNPRLEGLLRQMTRESVDRLHVTKSKVNCEYFACSAVRSTENLPNGKIKGASIKNGFVLVEMEPPRVPERWPDSWKQGDFLIQGVSPRFPENTSIPPGHIKMDRLVDFLLNDIG
jgi:predicted YcjX-like family ATPase